MTRAVVRIALAVVAALAVLVAFAASQPTARPQVERLLVAVVAAGALVGIAVAVARAHPGAAATALDGTDGAGRDRPTLPSELRWLASTFAPVGGLAGWRGGVLPGRAPIHRLGRERLHARGLDLDRPDHAAVARRLAGDHLWTVVVTPLDRPLPPVDLDDALSHLEAL